MRTSRIFSRAGIALALALALALAAAGGGATAGGGAMAAGAATAADAPPRMTLPEAMATLVPADAVALLYLESTDAVATDFAALRPKDAPSSGGMFDARAALLKNLRIAPERLDPTRPLAVALSLPQLDQAGAPPIPAPTYILPAADAEGLRADLARGPMAAATVVDRGDYVGLSQLPGYAAMPAPSSLTVDLPARTLVARVRTAEVLAALRPLLDMALSAMRARTAAVVAEATAADNTGVPRQATRQMMAAQELQTAWFEHVVDALAATDVLDLGLDVAQGQLQLDYHLDLLPGSERAWGLPPFGAAELADLTRCLPREYPLVALAHFEFDTLADVYEPWFRAIAAAGPGEGGIPGEGAKPREGAGTDEDAGASGGPAAAASEPFALSPARAEATLELTRTMGDRLLVAGGWTDEGLQGVTVFAPPDPGQYLQTVRRSVEAGPMLGVRESIADGPRIEGASTLVYTQQYDLEQLVAFSTPRSRGAGTGAAGAAGAAADSVAAAAAAEAALTRQVTQKMLDRMLGPGGSLVIHMAALPHLVVATVERQPETLRHVLRALRKGDGALPAALQELDPPSRARMFLWGQADLRALMLPALEIALEAAPDSTRREVADFIALMNEGPPPLVTKRGFLGAAGEVYGDIRMDVAAFQQMLRSTSKKKPAGGK